MKTITLNQSIKIKRKIRRNKKEGIYSHFEKKKDFDHTFFKMKNKELHYKEFIFDPSGFLLYVSWFIDIFKQNTVRFARA